MCCFPSSHCSRPYLTTDHRSSPLSRPLPPSISLLWFNCGVLSQWPPLASSSLRVFLISTLSWPCRCRCVAYLHHDLCLLPLNLAVLVFATSLVNIPVSPLSSACSGIASSLPLDILLLDASVRCGRWAPDYRVWAGARHGSGLGHGPCALCRCSCAACAR